MNCEPPTRSRSACRRCIGALLRLVPTRLSSIFVTALGEPSKFPIVQATTVIQPRSSTLCAKGLNATVGFYPQTAAFWLLKFLSYQQPPAPQETGTLRLPLVSRALRLSLVKANPWCQGHAFGPKNVLFRATKAVTATYLFPSSCQSYVFPNIL